MNDLLFILDAMNMFRRVYEANPAPDSEAKVEGALKAAQRTFENMLGQYPATHYILITDAPGKNWRHTLYPAYKENRSPIYEPLRLGIQAHLQRLKANGFEHLEVEGVEADDVINSVAKRASRAGLPSLTLSTDKDLVRLVEYSGCQVRDHFGAVDRTAQWCFEKFGVSPAMLPDLLALTGDTSDGIPGVYKVGVKTAAKWLQEFGSLEGVLANADSIKGKVGDNLRSQKDLARLSRQLVELRDDALPKGFSLDRLARSRATA